MRLDKMFVIQSRVSPDPGEFVGHYPPPRLRLMEKRDDFTTEAAALKRTKARGVAGARKPPRRTPNFDFKPPLVYTARDPN